MNAIKIFFPSKYRKNVSYQGILRMCLQKPEETRGKKTLSEIWLSVTEIFNTNLND